MDGNQEIPGVLAKQMETPRFIAMDCHDDPIRVGSDPAVRGANGSRSCATIKFMMEKEAEEKANKAVKLEKATPVAISVEATIVAAILVAETCLDICKEEELDSEPKARSFQSTRCW